MALLAPGSILLSGCHTAGATGEVAVLFIDRPTAAQQQQVRQACGGTPGIIAEPGRPGEVNVYFDIHAASRDQVNMLANCINQLAARDKAVGIRTYQIQDGSQS
jgi:hypothetical protein